MCEPTTIALVGGALSTGLTLVGMRQQNKAIAAAAEAQQAQINDQAAERTQARMEEARALRAQARAAAAEAAVSGNSIALLADDIMAQAGRDAALIEKNRRNAVMASGDEARGRQRAASAEALGQIAYTGMATYQNYQTAKYTIPGDT